MWVEISDSDVVHIWKGTKDDGTVMQIEITPDWYQDNGTPIDDTGVDMVYIKTLIKQDKNNSK